MRIGTTQSIINGLAPECKHVRRLSQAPTETLAAAFSNVPKMNQELASLSHRLLTNLYELNQNKLDNRDPKILKEITQQIKTTKKALCTLITDAADKKPLSLALRTFFTHEPKDKITQKHLEQLKKIYKSPDQRWSMPSNPFEQRESTFSDRRNSMCSLATTPGWYNHPYYNEHSLSESNLADSLL